VGERRRDGIKYRTPELSPSVVKTKASLTFYVYFNTVAAGANMIFSFFGKSINECNVVGTPGSGFGPSGEGCFRLPAFGHCENVIEAVERIKKNLK